MGFFLGLILELVNVFKYRTDCWYWEAGWVVDNIPWKFRILRVMYLKGEINGWAANLCPQSYEYLPLLTSLTTLTLTLSLFELSSNYSGRRLGEFLQGLSLCFLGFLLIRLRINQSDPFYYDHWQPPLPRGFTRGLLYLHTLGNLLLMKLLTVLRLDRPPRP